MIPSRRDATQNLHVDATTHAGLWLDKYFDQTLGTPKEQLVDEIAEKIRVPESYAAFFTLWRQSLEQFGANCRPAQVQGRLAIDLGADAVLETSIALHHTYGMPYIPGSALKGLAAHYTKHLEDTQWHKGGPAFEVVFGNTKSAGYVTFFDALYIPGSGYKGKALWPDVITVHHPDYYQTGDKPPADWDSPTPIPFLSATGQYLIALAGPPEWVEKAYQILELALEKEGVGAKTNSGYGRMKFGATAPTGQPAAAPARAQEPYTLKKQRLLHEKPATGRLRGTVADIHASGQYGKINPATGGGPMFVHVKQVQGPNPVLQVGQVVEYEVGQYQGRDQAQKVVVLLEPER